MLLLLLLLLMLFLLLVMVAVLVIRVVGQIDFVLGQPERGRRERKVEVLGHRLRPVHGACRIWTGSFLLTCPQPTL